MPKSGNLFHLAIPAQDLDEAEAFYVKGLDCQLARRYDDRITLNFFGDQVVCHLSTKIDRQPEMYPRHFGVTFRERADFDEVVTTAAERRLGVFAPVATRFVGRREEHLTFVLIDPSNNLVEFKWYADPAMMY